MKAQTSSDLAAFADKIARELTFAEGGQDLGLLPINSFLCDIEAIVAAEPVPQAVVQGVQQARHWIDEVFETTGTFSALALERFRQWVDWWKKVITSSESGEESSAAPVEWSNAAAPAVPVPTPAACEQVTGEVQDEPVIVLNVEDDRTLLGEFINESQEHLQNMEQAVLALEDNPQSAELMDSIFRAVHTLKGGSGFLNLTAMQSLAHELESLLDLARQKKVLLTPPLIDLVLAGGDTLKKFVVEISGRLAGASLGEPILIPTLKLIARIRAAQTGTSEVVSTAEQPANSANGKPEGSTRAPSIMANAVKVDTLKLDSLVDLVGEMVIAQSLVVQNPDLLDVKSEQLMRDLAHLRRITRDLQRTAMSLRMVPIGGLFQKLNRLVRDVAAKVGKEIEFVTSGEDTDLDRTIVEEIGDPLIHMIRNAIDHGVERPEIRMQSGKPARGSIFLKAFHQGGNIVLEVRDDGGGLNKDRIAAKAIERGLMKAGEQRTDAQIYSMILEAGFSTAETVTNISGRGVGMDVVRKNVEKLRGKLEIQSVFGQGTTFRIHLPLTLAIIDGLLVGVGKNRYIIPTLLVRESFRPTAAMISTVQGRGEMINVRGHLCPLLRLYSHLGVTPESTDPTLAIVVVVESGNNSRGVMVDRLLGKQEVVIKSLDESFRNNVHTAGAAILGDGSVGLILDPEALVNLERTSWEGAE